MQKKGHSLFFSPVSDPGAIPGTYVAGNTVDPWLSMIFCEDCQICDKTAVIYLLR